MKASLTAEGWKEDRRLPKGWMIKGPVPSSSTKVPEKPLNFLNEEAEELNAEEALEYLTSQNQSEKTFWFSSQFWLLLKGVYEILLIVFHLNHHQLPISTYILKPYHQSVRHCHRKYCLIRI